MQQSHLRGVLSAWNVEASVTSIVPVQRAPFASTRPTGPLFTRWIEAELIAFGLFSDIGELGADSGQAQYPPLNRTKGSGCQAAMISLMSTMEEAAVHTAVAMFAIIMGVGIATSWTRDLVRGRVDLSHGPFWAGEAGNDSLLWPHWLAEHGTAAALVAGGSGLLIAQGSLGCPDARTQYLSAIQLIPAARAIYNQRCTP